MATTAAFPSPSVGGQPNRSCCRRRRFFLSFSLQPIHSYYAETGAKELGEEKEENDSSFLSSSSSSTILPFPFPFFPLPSFPFRLDESCTKGSEEEEEGSLLSLSITGLPSPSLPPSTPFFGAVVKCRSRRRAMIRREPRKKGGEKETPESPYLVYADFGFLVHA